jgi:biotin-dependent carboxylase-like uncharacterized protein
VTLDILDGGLLTTVQDGGRRNWLHIGVPESGAMDPWSHAVANLLAGNDPASAVLELTLVGPTFAAVRPVTIALAGADLGARVRGGRLLAVGRSHHLDTGDVVEIGGAVPPSTVGPTFGARGYLAVRGGIDVPIVLGSRSTCLAAAFGGFAGRGLRAGDSVAIGVPGGPSRVDVAWPQLEADPAAAVAAAVLRVLATSRPGLDALVRRRWRVAPAANRVGVRLEPAPDDEPTGRDAGDEREHEPLTSLGGEVVTHGVPWGAVQLPPDCRPIILGADHQTTGGYAVVGVVISADLPILGQLRPGAPVRLVATDPATARAALRDRRAALAAGAASVRDAAAWDALSDAAGG